MATGRRSRPSRPSRPPPAVRFGDGRRPEAATHVQVAEFDGPLALLLSLIEARQLDVLTVPLGGAGRRLPRRARDARGRPAGQRQLRSWPSPPADPHQEPGDAAAPPGVDPAAARRRGARPRGRAARAAPAVPRPPRRRPAPGRRGARADRPVPARARRSRVRPGRPAPDPADAPPLDPARLGRALAAPRDRSRRRRSRRPRSCPGRSR